MTLRIGILGAARVAIYAMIAAAREVDGVAVTGVAARDPERARQYAETHGMPRHYPDYQALIDADDIDAVYVALPPSLHARWSIAALVAGKPVLCEKPFALSVADVDAMLAAEARSRQLLMEAQHSWYHPLNVRARALVADGAIGELVAVEGRFDAEIADTGDELRYMPDVGGGALWDLGIYPAHWIRSLLPVEPLVVAASQRLHPGGADMATEATLQAGTARARLSCAMDRPRDAWLYIEGTRGTIHLVNPLAPQFGSSLTMTVGGVEHVETPTTRPSYVYQLEAFRDGVGGAPVHTRGGDSRATIALLAAIVAAAS